MNSSTQPATKATQPTTKATKPVTQPTASVSTVSGYITDDYVNLRSGAGTSYSVVECMRLNTKVTFVSTKLYNIYWFNIKIT